MQTKKREIIQPKQKRAIQRVQNILEATRLLLLENTSDNGSRLDEVSTTAIAQKAGVPVGSVYQYFVDKNDILKQLYQHAYDDVEALTLEAFLSVDENASLAAKIESLLQISWLAAKEHPTFRILSRWANRQGTIWELRVSSKADFTRLIETTIDVTNIKTETEEDYAIVLRTTTIAMAALIAQAIEEEDETLAGRLIKEIVKLFTSYLERYIKE